MICLHCWFPFSESKINLEKLAANPDSVYDLLDELESDFEIDSDVDDDIFEPPISSSGAQDDSGTSSSEEEDPGPSTSKKPQSHWPKMDKNAI